MPSPPQVMSRLNLIVVILFPCTILEGWVEGSRSRGQPTVGGDGWMIFKTGQAWPGLHVLPWHGTGKVEGVRARFLGLSTFKHEDGHRERQRDFSHISIECWCSSLISLWLVVSFLLVIDTPFFFFKVSKPRLYPCLLISIPCLSLLSPFHLSFAELADCLSDEAVLVFSQAEVAKKGPNRVVGLFAKANSQAHRQLV